ncbi:hypothetical protein [Flavivirga spongiicola]|uniref:Uncharacterized protein n=1 Tax=Flavivirga spongiicola TaxID=421621 RepID=A0ABU7XP63_9FLAO|nr:hypothetical protein [Flavivirga sp. MEBiC05379]MDO5977326.1 hypothetical protein [Flavivirga sp. MEBiC05379]
MKKSTIIILAILTTALVLIGLFLWFILYESTTDISQNPRFKNYLNNPFIVTRPVALYQNPNLANRYSDYYVDSFSEEDTTLLKKYNIGDTITFTKAKRYFNNHVGETYYLLGREKLDTGETIEFEYSLRLFEYYPTIWETDEEFSERRTPMKDLLK